MTYLGSYNKASVDAINQVLIIKGLNGLTPLHIAAFKHDSAEFQALLNKASVDAINQALIIKDINGQTPLHWVVDKLDNIALLALLNKASPPVIRQALQIRNNVPKSLAWICSQIEGAMTPAALEPWVVLLLKLSGISDTRSAAKPLTELSALLDRIKRLPDPFLQKIAEHVVGRLPTLAVPASETRAAMLTGSQTIALANGDDVSLSKVDLIVNIQAKGLASWEDFYRLKKHGDAFPDNQLLLSLLNLMSRYNTLIPSSLHPSIHYINKELVAGHLLMKMFSGWQPKAWGGFVQQLEKPWERASLRKEYNDLERLFKPDETHKFHHLTGVTTPYAGKQIRPKIEHTTHAKKQSMTLISPEKCTPLFQSQQPETLLVGVAFRAAPTIDKDTPLELRTAKMRALLLSDQGTYYRGWRGSEQEVKTYAEKAKNYTSLTDFKTAIKENKKHTNEVLVQPSKESLLGIVIGRDTPKARKLARQYQQEILNKFGLTLPIIMYDAERRLLIEDLDLFENIKNKDDLSDERDRLLKTKPIVRSYAIYALLTGEGDYEGKTYPGDVLRRLREIDTNLAQINAALKERESLAKAPALDGCLGLSTTTAAQTEIERSVYSYTDPDGRRYRFLGAGAGATKEYELLTGVSTHSAAFITNRP